jgi:ABC-2 type transport system ATP-binding protein
MEEADNLCDRIAIIDHGKIVALDTSEKLKSALGGDIITLKLNTHKDAKKLSKLYEDSGCVSCASLTDSTVYLTVEKSEEAIPRVFNIAFESDINIQSVTVRTPTLDDVFINYTGRGIRDELVDDVGRVTYKMQTRKR